MTTYYISPSGNDSNNGLGPDASHASNKPWLTIGKALGAAGFASGDTVYIAPGTYREVVTVAMTSAAAETSVIGDPTNSQGFKDGSGVLLAPGYVIWTAYTTNDTTAPSTSTLLSLAGRDYLTFRNLLTVGGNNSTASNVNATTAHSTNIIFRDCAFIVGRTDGIVIAYTGLADTAADWTIDRCIFGGPTSGGIISILLPTSAAADYDVNFLVQNSAARGAMGLFVSISATGAGAFKGGGVDVFNCTALSRGGFVVTNSANLSTSIPCTVYNSVMFSCGSTALSANTAGQIVEDNNRIWAGTPRANVSVGANSVSDLSHSPLYEFGYELIAGMIIRPFGVPMAGSPLLGRGATAGGPTVDLFNRPRPAGGGSTAYAWGALERHDTGIRETSVVRTGANALKIVGPGDHDFMVPVDAASTTITVYGRFDANHADTNRPQMAVLNGTEIGVADATATMTAAVDTWEQLSLTFTPTAKGIVTIRLISRAAAGNGIAYFDDFGY